MNLAKSLHTVTVYQRFTLYFVGLGYQPEDAAAFTRQILGHQHLTDDYGLIEKAVSNVVNNRGVLMKHEVQA